MAMPGAIFPTTMPAVGPTAGARTGWPGFPTRRSTGAWGWRLWNERDPILKERLFGLNNAEGNHGEDVKELYFYVDGVPSHAYMRMLYKYPQAEFPYADLIAENARRGLADTEYEILDTGVFEDDRYFDVSVEYAKHSAGRYLHACHGAQPLRSAGAFARIASAMGAQQLELGGRCAASRA